LFAAESLKYQGLVEDLAQGDPGARRAASNSLISAKSDATPWLVSQLKRATQNELRSELALPQILKPNGSKVSLEGFDLNVLPRQRPILLAFRALGTNSQSAIPALLQALSSKASVFRQGAAAALGMIGRPEKDVLGALETGLSDQSAGTRKSCIYSLSKLAIDAPEVRMALLGAIRAEAREDVLSLIPGALAKAEDDLQDAAMMVVETLKQSPRITPDFRTAQLPMAIETSLDQILAKAKNPDLAVMVADALFEMVASTGLHFPTRVGAASVLVHIRPYIPIDKQKEIDLRSEDIQEPVPMLKPMLKRR
jgi:hypothetical protein